MIAKKIQKLTQVNINAACFLPQETPSVLIFKNRRRKKTISLTVKPDASVVVLVPFYAQHQQIIDFIQLKKEWIKKKIAQLRDTTGVSAQKKLQEGELFPYLGRHYALKAADDHNIKLDRNSLNISYAEKNKMKDSLLKWYKEEALLFIRKRVDLYSQYMRVSPMSIRITSARQRWGSCTHVNTINFPWRIIGLPPDIIDYIVVHELAHINQKNHSSNFWNIVSNILPDYKERKKWLKEKSAHFNILVA